MSATLYNYASVGAGEIVGQCYCDSVSELPATTDFSEGTLVSPSECIVINDSDKYILNSVGVWKKQKTGSTVTLDMSGYYTSAQTDSAISTALTNYYTQSQVDTAVAAANYFVRGTQVVATTDNHFNVKGITTKGAWYFGQSLVQYMDNMPPSYPVQGGQIRVLENQGTNRFIMEITSNSVAASGKVWRCWYTSNGWGDWYLFEGTLDV